MTLQELAWLGAAISGAGVVVTFIYVSIQIANTRAVRASTFQQVVNSFAAISFDIARDKIFYAGGTCGVLKGTQYGAKLKAMNAGLPTNIPVYDLAIAPSGKSIYAAVYGGGVYSFTTP